MRFGPLKGVGLIDPNTGKEPYANLQLRQDDRAKTMYNLVGFQTRLKWPEQKRVFGMIPGLENAEYTRYGVMHRNTFLNSPLYLSSHYNLRAKPDIFFAGQITGVEGYIDIQKVKLCMVDRPKSWWNGRRVYIGLDLSQTDDNTAVCMVTQDGEKVAAQAFGFIPGDEKRIKQKSDKERIDYPECIRRGECFPCGSEVIDYSFVEKFIIHTLPEEYGVDIIQVGYDRYNAISSVQKLEEAGIECVEIKQHSSVLHPATKWLKELILNGEFEYQKSRLLEINFQNARCTEDTNANKYVNKKKSSGKVDLVVGIINAVHLLQQEQLYGNDFVILY